MKPLHCSTRQISSLGSAPVKDSNGRHGTCAEELVLCLHWRDNCSGLKLCQFVELTYKKRIASMRRVQMYRYRNEYKYGRGSRLLFPFIDKLFFLTFQFLCLYSFVVIPSSSSYLTSLTPPIHNHHGSSSYRQACHCHWCLARYAVYILQVQLNFTDLKRYRSSHHQSPRCSRRKPRPRLHIRQLCRFNSRHCF